jgi:hypothetical protein
MGSSTGFSGAAGALVAIVALSTVSLFSSRELAGKVRGHNVGPHFASGYYGV